jgi:hypothetical protein
MCLAFMPCHFTFPRCFIVTHTTLQILDVNIPIFVMDDVIWMYEVRPKIMPLILLLTACSFKLLECHFNLWGSPGIPSWSCNGIHSAAVTVTANHITGVCDSTALTATVARDCSCDSRNCWFYTLCLKKIIK